MEIQVKDIFMDGQKTSVNKSIMIDELGAVQDQNNNGYRKIKNIPGGISKVELLTNFSSQPRQYDHANISATAFMKYKKEGANAIIWTTNGGIVEAIVEILQSA